MSGSDSKSITTSRFRPHEIIVFVAACLLFVGLLSVANYNYAKNNPGGNDFTMRWLATRLLVTEGQSPYSDETIQAVQLFMFGGPVPADHDQALFTYPLYAILFFLPPALIGDYEIARTIWLTTLQVALIIVSAASIHLAKWRLTLALVLGSFLYVLIWYYSVRAMINGNISILVGLLIVSALFAIRSNRDALAGMLLALSTIKPQVVVLLIPFLLLWAVSQRRRRLIFSTLGSILILSIASMLIVPDWIMREIEQIRAYPSYAPIGTPVDIFSQWWPVIGDYIGIVFSLLAILAVAYMWKYSWKKEFDYILPTIFLTLAATNFVGIATATSNYVVLFPGLILAFALYERRLGRKRRWLVVIFALLLLVGLWVLFWTSLSGQGQPLIMYFPLPLLLMVTFLAMRPEPPPGNLPPI